MKTKRFIFVCAGNEEIPIYAKTRDDAILKFELTKPGKKYKSIICPIEFVD